MPPKEAIGLLRKAGVKRALVSSSNDDGNQKLYAEAPDIILSSLRPYRSRGDIGTWVRDEAIVAYLEERLKFCGRTPASSGRRRCARCCASRNANGQDLQD